MSAGTMLPPLAALFLVVLLFAVVARVAGRTVDSVGDMFRAGSLRRPSGVQEDDDLRWSWQRGAQPPADAAAPEGDPARRR